jgi:hypothetical protein
MGSPPVAVAYTVDVAVIVALIAARVLTAETRPELDAATAIVASAMFLLLLIVV